MALSRLPLSDPIWEYVSKILELTYPEMCICWIDKIDNPTLKTNYESRKLLIQQSRGFVEEMTLFHGTSDANAQDIVKEGFQPSFNRTSVYGIGTYFSTSSKISSFYSRFNNTDMSYLFVCKVLVGKTKIGVANEILDVTQYDNTVNTTKNPTIYTTPYDNGAYPEYLVAFYKN